MGVGSHFLTFLLLIRNFMIKVERMVTFFFFFFEERAKVCLLIFMFHHHPTMHPKIFIRHLATHSPLVGIESDRINMLID